MPMADMFQRRIPADVLAKTANLKLTIPVGKDFVPYTITGAAQRVRMSRRTTDPREYKARDAQITQYLETVWQALRRGAVVIDHQQAHWLAGQFYRKVSASLANQNGVWANRKAENGSIVRDSLSWGPLEAEDAVMPAEALESLLSRVTDPDADLEALVGPLVNRLLLEHGIGEVDPAGRYVLLTAFRTYLIKLVHLRQRQADGVYARDPALDDIPTGGSLERPAAPASSVSLVGLVDDWWKEAKASGRAASTYKSYAGTFTRFAAWLGHDDARAVSAGDVLRYKTHLLGDQGMSPKTVRDNVLAGLKAVFAWAVSNHKVPANPAEGIKVIKEKRARLRGKDFTEAEATALLAKAALEPANTPVSFARRWIPWLCAYSGARVGEMAQLRREDLRKVSEGWLLTITPEANTVKDKEVREVLLHPHLVDLGFPDAVAKLNRRYIFFASSEAPDKSAAGVTSAMVKFARTVVTDPNVAPNHGWRHTFKTRGRGVGISDVVLDGITGHAQATQGGEYGSIPVAAQVLAMEKFPRFIVSTT